MEMTLKTKEVSEMLGVNPTTVQRWAKYFRLNYKTNEYGHYLFSKEHVELMKEVKRQLQEGKVMKEVDLSAYSSLITKENEQKRNHVSVAKYEETLEKVLSRVEQLEERLTRKADDVVTYQLLKHREELEEMTKMIAKLEKRLMEMEEKLQTDVKAEPLPVAAGGAEKKRWRLFSF